MAFVMRAETHAPATGTIPAETGTIPAGSGCGHPGRNLWSSPDAEDPCARDLRGPAHPGPATGSRRRSPFRTGITPGVEAQLGTTGRARFARLLGPCGTGPGRHVSSPVHRAAKAAAAKLEHAPPAIAGAASAGYTRAAGYSRGRSIAPSIVGSRGLSVLLRKRATTGDGLPREVFWVG